MKENRHAIARRFSYKPNLIPFYFSDFFSSFLPLSPLFSGAGFLSCGGLAAAGGTAFGGGAVAGLAGAGAIGGFVPAPGSPAGLETLEADGVVACVCLASGFTGGVDLDGAGATG
ncbi:MAG TPA: hypothetical protein VGF01_21865 [Terracidiphilus sp.]